MARVLVTGASGFIGRHLVPSLRAVGHEAIETGRAAGDVSHQATWKRFPRVDVVVHLAARSFVPDSWEAPGGFLRTNLSGTIEALEYCRGCGARLVFPSSYLYGEGERQPVSESSALVARNPYALSKKLAEEACQFYSQRFDVPITILRPFNIYGPGQSRQFLVPTIVDQVRTGAEVRVRDLEPRRDYIYVVDVVDAMLKAIDVKGGFGVFNVGSGISHSVADVIRTVQEVWGTDVPVRSERARRKDEVMDTVANISRAAEQLGWRPRFTLRHGLEELRAAE
jgi:GDP-4-dehydro-6-deoxy-D-mannose reductase